MADNFSLCLIGAMDRLWFHQIILFPEPFSLLLPKAIKQLQQTNIEDSVTSSPSSNSTLSLASLAEEETSATSSPLSSPDNSRNEEEQEEEEEVKERPTRVSLSSNRSRSHSSSPSTQKRQKKLHRHSTSCSNSSLGGKLQKSMSCRSMKDLELEEVKGFMDLGFIFKKEHLNKRMISVVPGLLRLGFGFSKTKQIIKTDDHKPIINLDSSNSADDDHDHDNEIDKEDDDHHDDFEQEKRGVTVMRPYLSEAWLIKRPDSPLLNLRVPKLSAAADMKKHLKNWAKTVASEIQQAC